MTPGRYTAAVVKLMQERDILDEQLKQELRLHGAFTQVRADEALGMNAAEESSLISQSVVTSAMSSDPHGERFRKYVVATIRRENKRRKLLLDHLRKERETKT